ncbi:MAG: hypothetical protein KF823_05735 [Xanthomonadales bacterium]|nr:hypothetical protein [Xanthomonadales bacterium]
MPRHRAIAYLLPVVPLTLCLASGPLVAAATGTGHFHAAESRREVADAIAYEDRFDPGHTRLVFSDIAFDRATMAEGGIDLTDFLGHPGAMLDFKIDPTGAVDMLIISAGGQSQYLSGAEAGDLLRLERRDRERIVGQVESGDLHRIRFDLPVEPAGQ